MKDIGNQASDALNDYWRLLQVLMPQMNKMWQSYGQSIESTTKRYSDLQKIASIAGSVLKAKGNYSGAQMETMAKLSPDVAQKMMALTDAQLAKERQLRDMQRQREYALKDYQTAVEKVNTSDSETKANELQALKNKYDEQIAQLDAQKISADAESTASITQAQQELAQALRDVQRALEEQRATFDRLQSNMGKGAVDMMKKWKLTAEQFDQVANAALRLADAVRSAGTAMTDIGRGGLSRLLSGRGFNKMDEWLGLMETLAAKGLHPLLLRQLMEAGPDSMGAARRLNKDGDLIAKANTQYTMLQGRITQGVGQIFKTQPGVFVPSPYEDGALWKKTGVLNSAGKADAMYADAKKKGLGSTVNVNFNGIAWLSPEMIQQLIQALKFQSAATGGVNI